MPMEALEAMAARPFHTSWGDTSGSWSYGDKIMLNIGLKDMDPTLRAEVDDLIQTSLRQRVAAIEASGQKIRGWDWLESELGSAGTSDPLNQLSSIAYRIYIHGEGRDALA